MDEGTDCSVCRDLGAMGVVCELADLPGGVAAVTARRGGMAVILVDSKLSPELRVAALCREVSALPALATAA